MTNPPKELINAEKYGNYLVRLPLYLDLTDDENQAVIDSVLDFFNKQ